MLIDPDLKTSCSPLRIPAMSNIIPDAGIIFSTNLQYGSPDPILQFLPGHVLSLIPLT